MRKVSNRSDEGKRWRGRKGRRHGVPPRAGPFDATPSLRCDKMTTVQVNDGCLSRVLLTHPPHRTVPPFSLLCACSRVVFCMPSRTVREELRAYIILPRHTDANHIDGSVHELYISYLLYLWLGFHHILCATVGRDT